MVSGQRNLKRVYCDHVYHGVARGRDGTDPKALEFEINDHCRRLSHKLRAGNHHFTQYRQMLMSKGAGKPPRVISVPAARDRIVLKALANFVSEVFPDTRAPLPQVCIDEVQSVLQTSPYNAYVRIDIENFYPSISHDLIMKELKRKIRKPEALGAIRAAIRTPTVADGSPRRPDWEANECGVPQGLAVSNLLAELVVLPIDTAMAGRSHFKYFRFVDDVLILCDSTDADEVHTECVMRFKDLGLNAHAVSTNTKSSIGAIADGFDYLGYEFRSGRVSVRTTSVRRVESALARAFTAYKKALTSGHYDPNLALSRCLWSVNLTVSGCTYKGVSRGWLQYFRQMDDLVLLKQLDATMNRLMRRFDLPHDFRPKTYMKAYWAIRHPRGDRLPYIPNFDTFSVDEMRQQLIALGEVDAYTLADAEVRRRFFRVVDRAVRDLERDVGSIS